MWSVSSLYQRLISYLLNQGTIFSAIDIRQGYHHIALSEDAIPKTAFSLDMGEKWEFVKVLFGLSQASACFMALLNRLLEGCEEFAFGYMDDILIYSPDEETYLLHIYIYTTWGI